MPGLRLATLVRRLRRDTAADGAGVSDSELLARFIRTRDDAAFELLVWRHGAMVLGACRRVLGNPEDAEDAFQATFLVLARKAASVSRGQALPAWLHRVALRLSFRLARSRRPAAELVTDPPAAVACDSLERDELRGVLDAEIDRLPEHCRRAVVLCYLEGLSGSEAARLLGCPTGTVESRLATARKRLRDRLTRRGVTLPVGILALVAGPSGLAAEVVSRTTRAGAAVARHGLNAATGIVREPAVKLAKGVLVMASVRTWAGLVLGVAMVAAAAGVGWANRPADGEPEGVTAVPETAPAPGEKEQAKPAAPAEAWPLAQQLSGYSASLVGVAQDGKTLVLRTNTAGTHAVYGLDLTGQVQRFAIQSPNSIDSAALSPDGRLVATAEGSNGVKLRDAATNKIVEALWPSGGLPAEQVAFTPDGSKLVVLCSRTETAEGKMTKKSKGGKDVTFGPGGTLTKYVKRVQISVWDVAGRKELGHPVESTTAEQGWYQPGYALSDNGRFVLKTEFVPPQQGGDETGPSLPGVRITVTDPLTGAAGKPVALKAVTGGPGYTDSLSPDGKTLAVMDAQRQVDVRPGVRLVDVATGNERATLGPLRRPIRTIAFSPDGKLIAAATGLGTRSGPGFGPGGGFGPSGDDGIAAPTEVVIWDASTGKELARLAEKERSRDCTALRFSPDGSFLVAQEADRMMTIWGHPPEPEADGPPSKGKGKGKSEDAPPGKGKGSGKGKATETPAAPAAVPDRFAALFRDLSADGVTDQRRVESLFLAALGRLPTDVESRTLVTQLAKRADKADALKDLLGTLVETAEFKAHAEALGRLAK
jgi:RNA polymerase sigma factor (sigma-70 family)